MVSEKLDGTHYAIWECEIELTLQIKGLWEVGREENVQIKVSMISGIKWIWINMLQFNGKLV